jgi:hypothetical protein
VSWEPLRAVMEAKGVWDSPAQAMVMTLLAKAHLPHLGYATVSHAEMARVMGVGDGYVQKVVNQLELEKEAVQPIAQKGQRNRYVLTLERAFAKAREEAGVAPDVPLFQLPRRARRARKPRVAPQGRSLPLGSAVPKTAGACQATPQSWAGIPRERSEVSRQGGWGDPTRGTPVRTEEKDLSKDQKISATAEASRLPLLGDVTPPVSRTASQIRDQRRSELFGRVERVALEILNDRLLGRALNSNAPIESETDLIGATKLQCARHKRIAGYGDVVVPACARAWFKFNNPFVAPAKVPRPPSGSSRR